jgi:hypothetical protein
VTLAVGAAGGAGLASSITGTSVTRGGGGGGSIYDEATPPTIGAGGNGGGGAGGKGPVNFGQLAGVAGGVNTGGGGGGKAVALTAGAGGKGVVIVRQAISASKLIATVTGGTFSVDATHIIYTFNDSGTLQWAVA